VLPLSVVSMLSLDAAVVVPGVYNIQITGAQHSGKTTLFETLRATHITPKDKECGSTYPSNQFVACKRVSWKRADGVGEPCMITQVVQFTLTDMVFPLSKMFAPPTADTTQKVDAFIIMFDSLTYKSFADAAGHIYNDVYEFCRAQRSEHEVVICLVENRMQPFATRSTSDADIARARSMRPMAYKRCDAKSPSDAARILTDVLCMLQASRHRGQRARGMAMAQPPGSSARRDDVPVVQQPQWGLLSSMLTVPLLHLCLPEPPPRQRDPHRSESPTPARMYAMHCNGAREQRECAKRQSAPSHIQFALDKTALPPNHDKLRRMQSKTG